MNEPAQPPETFTVPRPPGHALDAAEAYLEGAGLVAPPLAGRMERSGDRLVVHHGRLRSEIACAPHGTGAQVRVVRRGQVPLAESRRWLIVMGLVGTVVAWGLAAYNAQAGGVSPLVTIAIFFAALVAAVAVLYVVDRSVERQVHHLLGSLEEAMAGDAVLILSREMQGLARKAAVVNGILFYCAAMVAEFIIFTVLLSDGVRQGIDEAVTLEVMRRGFLLPIVPAIVFAAAYHWFLRRAHQARIGLVAARFPKGRPHPRRR